MALVGDWPAFALVLDWYYWCRDDQRYGFVGAMVAGMLLFEQLERKRAKRHAS